MNTGGPLTVGSFWINHSLAHFSAKTPLSSASADLQVFVFNSCQFSVLRGQRQLLAGVTALDLLIYRCDIKTVLMSGGGGAVMGLVAGSAQLSASLSSTHTERTPC